MNIKECFEKRLLIKIAPDKLKSESSMRIAEQKISRAHELFSEDFFNEALLAAYTSMFHAARSLLYLRGIQEKSHHAVYVYPKEKFSKDISPKSLGSFFHYQNERHKVLYGFEEEITKSEVASALEDAEEFLKEVKHIHERL